MKSNKIGYKAEPYRTPQLAEKEGVKIDVGEQREGAIQKERGF